MGSKIEWTDETWNMLRALYKFLGPDGAERVISGWHCEHVSEGCRFCYAHTFNLRMLPSGGTGLDYTRPNRDKVEIVIDDAFLNKPFLWKKPRKIFTCSMTDLFGEFVSDKQIDRVFAVMALCPQHTFLVLTKRAKRMREYVAAPGRLLEIAEDATMVAFDASTKHRIECATVEWVGNPARWTEEEGGCVRLKTLPLWPLPNVHLGISVESQATADGRIPELLATPAAKRFISLEPQLERVDLKHFTTLLHLSPYRSRLDQVIQGGESGPRARPFDIEWARFTRDQCRAAGAKYFLKQLGANVIGDWHQFPGWNQDTNGYPLRDRKGGDIAEFPEDLRIREFTV